MNKDLSFLDDEVQEITADDVSGLSTLVNAYKRAEDTVKAREVELKEAKAILTRISCNEIPDFMLARGIEEFKLTGGEKVTVKTDISVTVTDEALFRHWLKDRNEMDIIKTKCTFTKMGTAKFDALETFLINNDYDFDSKEAIHPQTKKKYFKTIIEELGQDNIPDFAKIYNIRSTKIK